MRGSSVMEEMLRKMETGDHGTAGDRRDEERRRDEHGRQAPEQAAHGASALDHALRQPHRQAGLLDCATQDERAYHQPDDVGREESKSSSTGADAGQEEKQRRAEPDVRHVERRGRPEDDRQQHGEERDPGGRRQRRRQDDGDPRRSSARGAGRREPDRPGVAGPAARAAGGRPRHCCHPRRFRGRARHHDLRRSMT